MKDYSSGKHVKPQLNVMTGEQLELLHNYSLEILSYTGIRVESETARDIFARSEAVNIQGDIVKIQSELVDHAIKVAPSSVKIFDTDARPAFILGEGQGDDCYFGIGVTNTGFQEINDDTVIKFRREHSRFSARLGDLLSNFDMVSTIGIPSDIPASGIDLYNCLDIYANTSKPQVTLISEEANIRRVFDLLEFLHGDISAHPFLIPYFNPITPLVLNTATSDKMIACIERGLPFMYSNYSMYGATTPVTEAGTLSLLNAELLAGLVFSQLVKEGSSIILGSLPAAFNMRSMGSYYTSSSYLMNLACAEMMKHYSLPHCGSSGSSNAWGADLIASGELWLNHLSSILGKVGCAPFVGGNFDSMAFSPSMVVLSDLVIAKARQFAKGFSLDRKSINLEDIHSVAHGGNYLTSESTLASMSDLKGIEDIWPPLNLDSWIEKSMPGADTMLRQRSNELFEKARISSQEGTEIIIKGEEYISSLLK